MTTECFWAFCAGVGATVAALFLSAICDPVAPPKRKKPPPAMQSAMSANPALGAAVYAFGAVSVAHDHRLIRACAENSMLLLERCRGPVEKMDVRWREYLLGQGSAKYRALLRQEST